MSATTRTSGPQRMMADAGHTLATNIQLLAVGLATSIVLARFLGPGGKGAYDLALATAGLVATLGGLSLHYGITYFVARSAVHVRSLLRRLTLYDVALVAGGGSVLWFLRDSPLHEFLFPPDLGTSGLLAIALVAGTLVASQQLRAMLVGLGRIPASNVREVAQNLTLLVLLAAAVLWTAVGPGRAMYRTVIWITVAAYGLGALLFLRAVLRERDPAGPRGFEAVARYSVPAHAGNVAQFLNYRLDFFFVSFFIDVSALGLYAVATSLAQLLWTASKSAAQVVLPGVASGEEDATSSTAVATRLSLWVAGAGALLFVAAGHPLIHLLYGPDFLGSYVPLTLLVIGAAPFAMANTLAAHLGGLGLPHLNFRASLAGLAVTVVLDLALIPRYGLAGAAIATSASYLVSTGILVFLFQRRTGVRLGVLVVPRRQDVALLGQVLRGVLAAFRGGRGGE